MWKWIALLAAVVGLPAIAGAVSGASARLPCVTAEVCKQMEQKQRSKYAEEDRRLLLANAARKAVMGILRDPTSAIFGQVLIVRKGGQESICGEVNAKNGFGGYTGMKPFVITSDAKLYMNSPERWNRHCAGVTISTR